ncbi:MAG: adenylate/guanylate cyclase domain-containing protein [Rhodobacteraceae bacterium]|nr:adenylate/guanylate cyclase domain-containing protein [Paracoccaceae bacterium]
MPEETCHKLAAVVCADVVGYSRLMGMDEINTLATMKKHRAELWEPLAERFGGRIVGAAGDSFLIEFNSAVAAVETAMTLQNGMLERNSGVSKDRQMLLRLGVNIGEIIVEPDGIFDDGVNIAARMQELAEPGCVVISNKVRNEISGRIDAQFF